MIKYLNYPSQSIRPHFFMAINKHRAQRGFALIIALSLMAFILLILVSLTTFVQLESQSANNQMESLRARENATLGALIALGDLQKHTGTDTGISARASLLDTDPETPVAENVSHPNWTGVWTRNSADGSAELQTWLVSGNRPQAGQPPEFTPDVAVPPDQNPVRLRAAESSGASSTPAELTVPSVAIGESGRFAFAVIGEQENISLETTTDPSGDSIPGFLPLRQGLEALGDPGFDPTAPAMERIIDPDSLALLPGADAAFIDAYKHTLSTRSAGLLVNTRDGGLKFDLTSALEGGTPTDGDPFVNFAAYGIPEDIYTTPSPTWGYLRSFYNFKDAVAPALPGGAVNPVSPRPATGDAHGVGPTIAAFSFGIAIGLRADNTLEYLWQPKVVLHNPYNVPLEAAEYGIYFFGLSPTEFSEDNGGDPAAHFPLALAGFNGEYRIFGSDSADPGGFYARRIDFHFARAFTWGVTGNSSVYRDAYDRTRNGEPASYGTIFGYAPGGPRFLIDAPRMEPGEAILFTPQTNRAPYIRAQGFNDRLVPGDRFAFFDYETPAELLPPDSPLLDPNRPQPTSADFATINIHIPDGTQVRYMDAVLTTPRTRTDVRGNAGPPLFTWPNSGGRSRQMFRDNNRADLAELQDDIYHMTARIPYNHPEHYEAPVFSDLIYNNPVPPAAANSVAWHALAYGPVNPPPGMAFNPYRYFNPRAKIGEPADLKSRDAGGRAQHTVFTNPTDNYFYEPFVGTLDAVPLETYGPLNDRVRIGGGPLNPVADTQVLYDLPRDETGLYSLGQLQHVQFSQLANEAGYAFGNSHAPPLIPRDEIFVRGLGPLSMQNGSMGGSGQPSMIDYSTIDLSYILNDALWDRTFFATTADETRVNAALAGTGTLPNPRLRPLPGATLAELQDPNEAAAHLLVDGAFNINSTSVEAWMAFLAGNNLRELDGTPLESPFFRLFGNGIAERGDPWTGFSEIELAATDPADPPPIRLLAEAIVEQVKRRGPFTSLADFVNRRLENSDLGLSGTLQSAIDASGINDGLVADAEPININNSDFPFEAPAHFQGETADGIPGWLSQADILTAIGPFITTRNDTFTILAQGESTSFSGDTATARLEMTVQRLPGYVSGLTDATDLPTPNSLDDRFGRNYVVVSARWVEPPPL